MSPETFVIFFYGEEQKKNGTQKLAAVCTGGNKVVVVLSHCSHSSSKLESFKKLNLRLGIQIEVQGVDNLGPGLGHPRRFLSSTLDSQQKFLEFAWFRSW